MYGKIKMNTALFFLETRRFFSRKKLIFLFLIFILLLIMGAIGIKDYKQSHDGAREFQEAERMIFSELDNFSQYSFQGLRFVFLPSGVSTFFNNYNISRELTARLTSVTTLDIFCNLKGKELAARYWKEYMDFAGVFLIFFGLFALVLGYEIPADKEYLKYLSTIFGIKRLFNYMLFIRYILIMVTFLFILGIQLILLKIMGINFIWEDWRGLNYFMVAAAIVILFFLLSGSLIGLIRSKSNSFIRPLAVWFVLVFLLPWILYLIGWEGASDIQNSYQSEVKKMSIIVKFERMCQKKQGDFDRSNIKKERELIDEYYKKYYPKIIGIELKDRENIANRIQNYWKSSIIMPTTFYNMVCREVSSGGYGSFLQFYDFLISQHEAFSHFWVDHVFYGKPDEMESFIKGDENLFHGESQVPPYFLGGTIINLAYCLLLYILSLTGFNRILRKYEDIAPFKKKEDIFPLNSKQINTFFTDRPGLRDYLYMIFTGNNSFLKNTHQSIEITLDGKHFKGDYPEQGFRYICQPNDLPGDMKGSDFINFELRNNRVSQQVRKQSKTKLKKGLLHKTIMKMTIEEKFQLLSVIIPHMQGNIFLFYHTCKGLTLDFYITFKNQLKLLQDKGATIIYLSPETSVHHIEKKRNRDILPLKYWVEELESMEDSMEENFEGE